MSFKELNYNEALDLLQKANEIDNYRSMCKRDIFNARARASQIYAPWTDQKEATAMNNFLSEKGVPARCIIMNPSADGGMPHTRGTNLICIPAYWPQEKLKETLRHEVVHIHQKQNMNQWKEKLLENGWSYLEDSSEIPEEILQRCRLNPDTIQARFFSWAGRWIPLPLFEREDKPNLKEIQVRWWDRQEGILLLDPPFSFTQKYGTGKSVSEIEHPFELYAYAK